MRNEIKTDSDENYIDKQIYKLTHFECTLPNLHFVCFSLSLFLLCRAFCKLQCHII